MRDPFRIESPTCISFSGGRTSAYMLWRVLQANGGLPADTVVCFANTGKEVEATLRFVRGCAKHWQVPIHWLEYRPTEPGFAVVDFDTASRKGEPFEALIRKPIKELVDELDPQAFWQIHRSTLVNVKAIAGVTRDFRGRQIVSVKGHPEKLEVSRSYLGLFKGM